MAKRPEEEHSAQERNGYRRGDDHGELLESDQLAAEERDAAAQSGNRATENADSHLGVGLLNLLVPRALHRVLVVRSQVNDIVDCQTDHDDDGNGLGYAELPALKHHDSNNTHDDDGHGNDGEQRQQNIARSNQQNEEREADGCRHSCRRRLQEGPLRLHPAPEDAGGLHS